MKKIEVVLDAIQLSPLVEGLADRYLYGFTLSRVAFGFSNLERGFKLEMVVRAGLVPEVLELLSEIKIPPPVWRDGAFGPTVIDVEDAMRIRTGEEGSEALLYLC